VENEISNQLRSTKKGRYRAENNAVRKVIMLGDAGVGKTAIINRVIYNSFTGKTEPTIGNQTYQYGLNISSSSKKMNFNIWDISGQDQYMSITSMYYRDIDAAILCYDMTDKGSYTNLKKWFKQLNDNAPENISIALVANKYDMIAHSQVDFNEGNKIALQHKCSIFKEVSAKSNVGLNEVLQKLGEEMSLRPTNVSILFSNPLRWINGT
jgi:small GTP-binding protein